MLDQETLGDAEPKFKDMQNIVHIDEKWYFMTKNGRKYYSVPEEDDPVRMVQNKNSIGKVMFLTAVGRPKYDEQQNLTFSRKLGVWPFVKVVPAARWSRNRDRGTLETKSVIVNRGVMRQYMIEKVISAIEKKWPREDAQQDNARTHLRPYDPAFLETVAKTGLDIRLMQ
jgi:hypothetical protein